MRCKACDLMLTTKDLQIEDELCRRCLATIPIDESLASQIIEDEEEVEERHE